MIMDNSSKAIAWLVKNKITCNTYVVDRVVSERLDSADPASVKIAQDIEEHVFTELEQTPEFIRKLRIASGLEFDDSSRDDMFKVFSEEEALDCLLRGEGIIGYTSTILGWIDEYSQFKKAQAEKRTSKFGGA